MFVGVLVGVVVLVGVCVGVTFGVILGVGVGVTAIAQLTSDDAALTPGIVVWTNVNVDVDTKN